MISTPLRIAMILFFTLSAPLLSAASSDSFSNAALTARLVSVEDGVAPNAKTLSLGLDLKLGKGWKAYWRSPGEVGLPPEIDWSGSENLASAELLWPAPTRFTAFGIENFGYSKHVLLPIQAVLIDSGTSANLTAQVSLLTCSDICVPNDFTLNLTIPAGQGIDTKAATLITEFAQRVPQTPETSDIAVTSASLTEKALIVTAQTTSGFNSPDVFPEVGPYFTFGLPDIRLNASKTEMWARLPLLAGDEVIPAVTITITDGTRAVTNSPLWSDSPAPAPYDIAKQSTSVWQVLSIIGFAFLGGVILNVMPCVLPVLSIKLASVMKHENRPAHIVRGGFLMSALGVLGFMWILVAIVLILQAAGFSVGWGLQFQSPVFLTLMFVVLVVFAANLFGLFEISLPSSIQTRLANSGGRDGYAGDFATGAFAAILATPCSAPFLGTAIAFALTGSSFDVVMIFTSLGLGLALPYLLFAARPGWVKHLPKPGRWMVAIKLVLGALLAITAAWLLWVLVGVAGIWIAGVVSALALVFVLCSMLPALGSRLRTLTLIAVAALALIAPFVMVEKAAERNLSQNWTEFNQSDIPRLVSQGKTVFVDVTADWCLTCKVNKGLVLDREPVATLLRSENVVAMQADWTRPNSDIAAYLETQNRFGIPFNIVYGPSAPNGILLSEILSISAVVDALETARKRK